MIRKNFSLFPFLFIFIILLATFSFSQQTGSVERIVISTNKNTINEIENVKADIINTIRIKNFEIIESKNEKNIKESPELKEHYEDLNISLFFFK